MFFVFVKNKPQQKPQHALFSVPCTSSLAGLDGGAFRYPIQPCVSKIAPCLSDQLPHDLAAAALIFPFYRRPITAIFAASSRLSPKNEQ